MLLGFDNSFYLIFRFLTFNELCNVINETKNDIIMKNLNMLYEIAQELCKYLIYTYSVIINVLPVFQNTYSFLNNSVFLTFMHHFKIL